MMRHTEAPNAGTVSLADLQTGFARAGCASGDGIDLSLRGLENVFLDETLVVDWNLAGELDPEVYKDKYHKEAAKDIETAKEWAENGALVMEFSPHLFDTTTDDDEITTDAVDTVFAGATERRALLGLIKPGTEIEVKSYEAEDGTMKNLTALQMTDVVEIGESDEPALFDTQKHPRMTFRNWHVRETELRAAYRRHR